MACRTFLLTSFLLLFLTAPAVAERFEAVLRDGQRIVGDRLDQIHTPAEAYLGEQALFNADNPVRRLRDTQQPVRRRGMLLEMTNGDVLPGWLTTWSAQQADGSALAQFTVAVGESHAASDLASGMVAVRADCVRRVYLADVAPTPYTPRLVIAQDGRRAVARGLRFTSNAVHALTETGVLEISFADLRELHLPTNNDTQDVLRDGVWSDGEASSPVVRLMTTNGAEITYCASMAVLIPGEHWRRDPPAPDRLAIRPSWSLDTLHVNLAAMASLHFRAPTEVPLSLLPAEVLEQRSILHAWPWRRNANVRGGRLQSGLLSSELGVGMHSYSAVAFTLPPGAREFRSWVGLDTAVGNGGCVRCRVLRDNLDGELLWESPLLRGGTEPLQVGPLNVQDAARLVLVVDFAHEERPPDADPWDVRDEVNWIDPLVTIDGGSLPSPESEPHRWIPLFAGWEVPEAMQGRFSLRPVWDLWRKQWTFATATDLPGSEEPFELTRQVQVNLARAVLPIAAANDKRGNARHAIYVKVDGQKVDSTSNGGVRTKDIGRDEPPLCEWSLGKFRGQQVQVSVVVEPLNEPGSEPTGVVWRSLGPTPLVDNLRADGQPFTPDVPLTSLTPLSAVANGKPIELQPGRLTNGKPLMIRGWQFEEGFGAPAKSEITYRLEPQWRRFVAIVGLADGWQGVGPYAIMLDGELYWECNAPLVFGRQTPGLQINVPIPPGHKTITLRVGGEDSQAAWACSGFCEE